MTGVLVVVLAISLAITYRTLTRSAEAAVETRISRAARQLGSSLERAANQRVVLQREVARDSAIRRVLQRLSEKSGRTKSIDALANPSGELASTIAAARSALARLTTRTDSGLPIELWSEDGHRLISIGGDSLSVTQLQEPPAAPAWRADRGATPRADSARFSEFYALRGHVFFDITLPVYDGGRRVGYITEQHRIAGSQQAVQGLRELIGEDVAGYYRNQTGSFWSTLGGIPETPPERRDSAGEVIMAYRPGTGRLVSAEAAIAGTPWEIVLELPASAALAPARATTLRLGLLSILLVVVSAAASWIISRRITRPLGSLSAAAEALARGDYTRHVDDSGGDEVARLAKSFNHMRMEVGATRQELEEQIEEAQAIAEELEQTNEQLLESKDAAELANRAKSDFLAVMSHELRTPLNAIGGYVQLIELGVHGPVTEPQREALSRITRGQQRLLTLINDVLNFAKLDAGQVHYERTDVSLDDALSGLEAVIAPQMQAKGLHYVYMPCNPPLTAVADHDKVQQVVLNLLSNAIKFTAEGGRITVECDGSDAEVRVHVRDTGIGISPERVRTVFEPFVQVDRTLNRPHDGVGLGLAISRDLARGMGGDLTVESAVGEGSTFTLTLPRAAHIPESAARYPLGSDSAVPR